MAPGTDLPTAENARAPRLLVLEAGVSAGEPLLRAAAALGAETYVVTHPHMYAGYPPELRQLIAGTICPDFTDPTATLRQLTAFCRRTGIDGVVACWEFLTPLAAHLAAGLGLPGHDPARAAACRDKRLMSEAFTAHGIPAPRTVAAREPTTLARLAREAGLTYPLVVKPAENAASIGVSVVSDPAALPDAVRRAGAETHKLPHGIALDTTVLAQEYVEGDEFSVETVVVGGEVHHLAVTEKFTTSGTDRAETGHTVPATLPTAVRESLLDTTSRAVTALGLRDGLAHTEIKVTPHGRPHVIEVGARPPGDGIMRLVAEATGVDQARACVETALGIRPDLTGHHGRAAAVRFLLAPHAGTLGSIEVPPRRGHVRDVTVTAAPGDTLTAPHDNLQRLGHILLRGKTAEEVNEAAARAMARVRVVMTPRPLDASEGASGDPCPD
ncbi:ATP-grasp domain-containing protein [Streptomyces collinus]|uniref:ATP-grasp domain-containing protein n=1 Tax=Streptomyces collinus TaxID=42684 RepID=UPI0004240A4D|nr:ATP-grasp domain-containing protein [Streptomyces collinus]